MLSARTELMSHTADVVLWRWIPKPLGVVAAHPLPVRKELGMLSARTELMNHTADVVLWRRNPKPLGVVASHPLPVRKEVGSNPSVVLCAHSPLEMSDSDMSLHAT